MLVLASLLPLFSTGQDTLYFQEDFTIGERAQATYYQILSDEGSLLALRIFYVSNNRLFLEEFYIPASPFYVKDGLERSWNLNGQLTSSVNYVRGRSEGPYFTWYGNGNVKSQGQFFENAPVGAWISRYENGEIKEKGNYTSAGYEIENSWAEDGTPMVIDGTGEHREYHASGQLKLQGAYVEKQKQGTWTSWYEDGNVLEQAEYLSGKVKGYHSWYYPNGQLEVRGKYRNGYKIGQWAWYDEVGRHTTTTQFTAKKRAMSSTREEHFGNRPPYPINLGDIQQAIGYPREAMNKKIDGTIQFILHVDANGKVMHHFLLKPAHNILNRAVLAHISSLRFSSPISDSHRIQSRILIPFHFKLLD